MAYPTIKELKEKLKNSGDVFVNPKDEKVYWKIVESLREQTIKRAKML